MNWKIDKEENRGISPLEELIIRVVGNTSLNVTNPNDMDRMLFCTIALQKQFGIQRQKLLRTTTK